MRIECENCNAAYTIGDALLSDQPIGAQCPYCGHVRVVRRGDPPSAKAAAAPGNGKNSNPSLAPLGRPSVPPGFSPGGTFSPPSMPPSGPYGGGGGIDVSDLASPGGGAAVRSRDRFGPSEPEPRPPSSSGSAAKCQVCGTELTDEFDKVIGLCEVHQRERSGQEFGASPAEVREWRVRQRDGTVAGPYSLAEVRNALSTGEVSAEDQFAKEDFVFGPIDRFPELRVYAKRAGGGGASVASASSEGRARPAPARRPSGGGGGVSFGTIVLGLILLGLIGAGAYVVMDPTIAEAFLRRFSSNPNKGLGPLPPNPLKRQLDDWRKKHPDVSGSPDEHLVGGRARHLEDTWQGYQLAEEALQRALILDEDNPRAIAMYVENQALWKGPLLSEEELRLAEAAIRYALAAAPEDAGVQRGRAALSLIRGDLNGCRAAAEKAITLDGGDAQARLLLAGSFLEGNVILAVKEAEQAQSRLPSLRRADRVLARAYANAGRYASAVKLLDKRLEADPKNAAVHWLRGDLDRELAELESAKRHYREAIANPGDEAGARLALGELLIEQRDNRGAVEAYRLVVEKQGVPLIYKATALSGLARAEADANRLSFAKEYAAAALKIQPREAVALLVLAEIALEAGSATTAVAQGKRALEAREGEPAALVVLARASIAQRKGDEAVRYAEEAVQNDPRDPRLRAVLGGVYLAVGGTDRAFTVMKQAGDLDPLERESRHRKGLLALSERSQREAIQRFREAARELRDRSVASSSAAMLHYFLNEQGRAKELIDVALDADDSNTTALVYAAQMAIDRGAFREAEEPARRALRIDRGAAIPQLILGRVLAGQGKNREARDAFDAALRSAPGLLIAGVERAALQLAEGQKEQAIETLAHAHRVNPHLLRTRRLLVAAGY